MLIPYLEPDDITFEILWILFYLIQMAFTGFLMGRVLERRYPVSIAIGGWVVIVGVPLIPAILTTLTDPLVVTTSLSVVVLVDVNVEWYPSEVNDLIL